MFAFLAFVGFESTAVFRTEARDPDRTVPRATYAAVLAIGLLYAFTGWATALGVGTDQVVSAATEDPASLFPSMGTRYIAPYMHDLLQVLLVTSFFACLLSLHNVVARYLWTLGLDGMLPAALGVVNERLRSPSRASLTVTCFSAVIVVACVATTSVPINIYTWLSGIGTVGIMAMMVLTCLAVVVFFRRTGHDPRIWHTLVAPAIALLSLGAVLYMIVKNLPMLVGGHTAAYVIGSIVPLMFAAGVIRAMILRRARTDAAADDIGPQIAAGEKA